MRHHGDAAGVEGASNLQARRSRVEEDGLPVQDPLRHRRPDRALLGAVGRIVQELLGVLVLRDGDCASVGAAHEARLGQVLQVPADG